MPAQFEFFDMAVSLAPPNGHLEPLPLTLGPNWQPNDIRLFFVSASGADGSTTLTMSMVPTSPTGFTAAYSLNPTSETHGVYYRRLVAGDTDTSVAWTKPSGWRHFMLATLTVRGVSPTTNPTGGSLDGITHVGADAFATVPSVAVPAAGSMVFFVGNVPSPAGGWPSWAVATGVPTGWKHLVATDKSGLGFYPYDTNPSLVVAGKAFSAAGSTGSTVFPTAQGAPAFAGLYVFLTPAPDVSAVIGAA